MKTTREVNLREAIERQNLVVLLTVGSGSGNPGAGIIDRLYLEYDTSATNPIRMLEHKIKADPVWLAAEQKKATDMKIPLAEMIRTDAINLFNAELYKKK